MKLILDNAIGELNLMIADRMKNFDDIEMKIILQEGEIKLERWTWNECSKNQNKW